MTGFFNYSVNVCIQPLPIYNKVKFSFLIESINCYNAITYKPGIQYFKYLPNIINYFLCLK